MQVDSMDLKRSLALNKMLLHKVKFNLDDGEELLAAHQLLMWSGNLHKRIELELTKTTADASMPEGIAVVKKGKRK